MPYIPVKRDRIGEWVTTKETHTSCSGTFTVGSKVKIVGVSERGYDIEDEFGNKMREVGFII